MQGTATAPSFSRLRQRGERRLYRVGLGVSTLVHVGLIGTLVGLQLWGASRAEPIEYVAVQLVPAQALGSPDAPLEQEPVRRTEPEPVQPEPQPETQPEPIVAEPEPAEPATPAPSLTPEPKARPSDRSEETRRETPRERPRQERPQERPPAPSNERFGSATGSATSSSAFGGAEVAGFDNPDFVYGYYTDRMLGMIQAQWLRPSLGGGVEAAVHYVVHRDGSISKLRVKTSSGYSQFDLAGLRAIQSAAPFPPLPQSYPHRTLGVTLVFR